MAISGCSMNRGAFQGEVLDQDGGSLVDQDVHALHVALEGSKVQRGAALAVPHIEIHQRLHQDLQGVVVPVIGLRTQKERSWGER